jgi:predicted DNA-binding transcriptional regulator AlpA
MFLLVLTLPITPKIIMSDTEELLSVEDFSVKNNLPKRTVYRLLQDGTLPKIVFNKRTIRIPTKEAELVFKKLTQHSLVS